MEKENIAEIDKIQDIVKVFVEAADPQKVYLFGSFATGKNRPDSDYDFYIVVDDSREKLTWDISDQIEQAIGLKRNRGVDIFVVTDRYYQEHLQQGWPIEKTIEMEGVLLYDRHGKKVA